MFDDTPITNEAETPRAGRVLEATTHNIREKIIESLRKTFSGNEKVQEGDSYLDRSCILLCNNLRLMHHNDKMAIEEKYTMYDA